MIYQIEDNELILIPETQLDHYHIGIITTKIKNCGVSIVDDESIIESNFNLEDILTNLVRM